MPLLRFACTPPLHLDEDPGHGCLQRLPSWHAEHRRSFFFFQASPIRYSRSVHVCMHTQSSLHLTHTYTLTHSHNPTTTLGNKTASFKRSSKSTRFPMCDKDIPVPLWPSTRERHHHLKFLCRESFDEARLRPLGSNLVAVHTPEDAGQSSHCSC